MEDDQSELSSAITDPNRYSDLWELTDKIMKSYKPVELSDNTCVIIRSFRQILSKDGAIALMTDIKTIGGDQPKLRSFSRHLIDNILKPNAAISIAQSANIQSSDSSRQQYLKEDCLKRDGFRCAYSHVIDLDSARKGLVVPPVGMAVSPTQLLHILPLALKQFCTTRRREGEAVNTAWYSLYRYFPGLKGKIGPESLDQHRNLITVERSVHDNFDSHVLAFKPISGRVSHSCSYFSSVFSCFTPYLFPMQSSKYEIVNLLGWPLLNNAPEGHQEVMTLTSWDDKFPLPEPEFFRAHYQIAKILDASGIGADLQAEMEAEMEGFRNDPENLNPDGSTDVVSILCRKFMMNV
ncbi:uncharacterized protein CTRU02_205098 [Colletotrichum truncatum]|uniref:Uncharacterized protein n=1 Tax=Colletotrichum truncatum TaxID=5467 RepID=A0ACC3Z303_COLTU